MHYLKCRYVAAMLAVVAACNVSASIIAVEGNQYLFGTAADNGIKLTYISGNGSQVVLDNANPTFFIADGAAVDGSYAGGEQNLTLSNNLLTSSSETNAQAFHQWVPDEHPGLATFGSHSTLILNIDLGAPNSFFSFSYDFDINILGEGSTATWFGAVNVGDTTDDYRYLDKSFELISEALFNGNFSGSVQGFSVLDHVTILIDSQMSGGGGSFMDPYLVTGRHAFRFSLDTTTASEISAPGGFFLFTMCVLLCFHRLKRLPRPSIPR